MCQPSKIHPLQHRQSRGMLTMQATCTARCTNAFVAAAPRWTPVQKQRYCKCHFRDGNRRDIVSEIPEVPLTVEHPVPKDLDKHIPSPAVPRAFKTVSKEFPDGDEDAGPTNRTVLQQHVDFFDTDGDGIIFPWDTFTGFRRMGYNPLVSFVGPLLIHGSMSYATLPNWIPDLRFPIYTDRIHKCKHGSDSEVFDHQGRYVPQHFEEIFTKYDKDNKGALTWDELQQYLKSQRDVFDLFGASAAFLEWTATWIIAAENGVLSKEAMRKQYDGSLFREKAMAFAKTHQRRGI